MKDLRSALCLFLCVLLLVPVLAACSGGSPEDPAGTDADAPDGAEDDGRTFALFDGDGAAITLVRPADADDAAGAGAEAFLEALRVKTGRAFTLADDTAADGGREILIGTTNREQSRAAAAEYADALADDTYVIAVRGDKICVLAQSAELMRAAAENFSEYWLTEQSIKIPQGGVGMGRTEPTAMFALNENTRPAAITPRNATKDIVIADVLAADYGADPTGAEDSTDAIREALAACSALGGGTVWLGMGRYLVTDTIEIPAFVTLRGERPLDEIRTAEDYGTVILAAPESGTDTKRSLFLLRGSGGVIGMTVYYPEQDVDDPKPYPCVFYIDGNGTGGYMLSTVQDVLVVNGWDGIGACVTENNAHEQTTVENFRGTFLHTAVSAYNEADVGTFRTIRVSPSYWADNLLGERPDIEKVRAYTREKTTALLLGDLEWDQFADIQIEDCKIAVRTEDGKRATFTGEMTDVLVRNCTKALEVRALDGRWGMNLARSVFEDCPTGIKHAAAGYVKVTDCAIDGTLSGPVMCGEGELSSYAFDYGASYVQPEGVVWTVKLRADVAVDVSSELQDALDRVKKAGGGALYLPAGFYRVDHPVAVPAGVELRGSSSTATRDQGGFSRGTVIVTSYGLGADENETALVTLGAGAGVNGMRFIYSENGPTNVRTTPFVIRGAGEGVYCVNSSITAAGSGIDFRGCDGHYIKKVTACCYDHGIAAGGEGGVIEGCLQNGNVITRNGMDFLENWIPESEIFQRLFPCLRSRSVFLTLEGARGERVLNYFAYGVKTVVEARDSSDVVIFNLGGDNIGDKAPLVKCERSALTVINAQRFNGVLYEADAESDLSVYNPLAINQKDEGNLIHGEEKAFQWSKWLEQK